MMPAFKVSTDLVFIIVVFGWVIALDLSEKNFEAIYGDDFPVVSQHACVMIK